MGPSISWVLALAACGHGESPAVGEIAVHANGCSNDALTVRFGAMVEVGLEPDQAIRIAFLPALDGVQFSRTTTWECGDWSVLEVQRGCAREPGQPEIRQVVSVTELDRVNAGTLPVNFSYTMVVTIADVVAPTVDIENAIVTGDCN